LDLTSLSVFFLSHGNVIDNKELAQVVLTRQSPHEDGIKKSGLRIVRVFAAVWTFEHENSVMLGAVVLDIAHRAEWQRHIPRPSLKDKP
jgi:hypothetical protein